MKAELVELKDWSEQAISLPVKQQVQQSMLVDNGFKLFFQTIKPLIDQTESPIKKVTTFDGIDFVDIATADPRLRDVRDFLPYPYDSILRLGIYNVSASKIEQPLLRPQDVHQNAEMALVPANFIASPMLFKLYRKLYLTPPHEVQMRTRLEIAQPHVITLDDEGGVGKKEDLEVKNPSKRPLRSKLEILRLLNSLASVYMEDRLTHPTPQPGKRHPVGFHD